MDHSLPLQLYNSLISIQQEFQGHPTIVQQGHFNPQGSYNPYAVNSQVFMAHPVDGCSSLLIVNCFQAQLIQNQQLYQQRLLQQQQQDREIQAQQKMERELLLQKKLAEHTERIKQQARAASVVSEVIELD